MISNKDKDLRDIIFANAFFQELVIQGKEEPEVLKELDFKDRHITLFSFDICNDMLLGFIRKAGLENEYSEYRKIKMEGIRDLLERDD